MTLNGPHQIAARIQALRGEIEDCEAAYARSVELRQDLAALQEKLSWWPGWTETHPDQANVMDMDAAQALLAKHNLDDAEGRYCDGITALVLEAYRLGWEARR